MSDKPENEVEEVEAFEKNWETPCIVCRDLPTVAETGLCGPCCWGEAETAGGNW